MAAVALLLATAPALAACRAGTVSLRFDPEVGDRFRYRYDIEATVTQALDGSDPVATTVRTTLLADQTVQEVAAEGTRATVTLRRDGGPPRTAEVRLDRAGALQGVDLIEGRATGVFGLGALSGVLPTVELPHGPLAPGDRWSLDSGPVTGEGRLERLGVVDGERVAVVRLTSTEELTDTVTSGTTSARLEGALRTDATSTYDLHDGALRRVTSRSTGEVQAHISPPPGLDTEPVLGTITYEIEVRVTRLG